MTTMHALPGRFNRHSKIGPMVCNPSKSLGSTKKKKSSGPSKISSVGWISAKIKRSAHHILDEDIPSKKDSIAFAMVSVVLRSSAC